MPFGIQPIHIIVIILVAFLIFGASKLPEMGRSLGKTISEFRKGTKEAAEGFKEEVKNNATPTTPAQVPPTVASPAGRLTGNYCINCGSPNLAEARFCANCGTKLPAKIA
jgi:sec-independent protein translocase protein TatA